MKLLTLNTHSLIDKNFGNSAEILANAIIQEKIDVIALQEVNQPVLGDVISTSSPISVNYPIKNGNYILKVLEYLKKSSHNYYSIWYGFKKSYGMYEEGVGIITRLPVKNAEYLLLSSGRENPEWKRRCAVGIATPYGNFYSTHMGWWQDKDEPFLEQWERLKAAVCGKSAFIMGDFNAESDVKGEGYDLVTADGFYDTYCLAESRDDGFTVADKIDGWQTDRRKRIDYIFSNSPLRVINSAVIFDGKNYAKISDHFGVVIEIERE